MPSFANRSDKPEIMDDLNYAGGMMDQTLRELEIINRWLGGNAVTLSAIGRLLRMAPVDRDEGATVPSDPRNLQGSAARGTGRHLEIADLGCGRGDMLRHIFQWAHRRGLNVSLTGIDANPYIIDSAQRNLKDLPVDLKSINIFSGSFKAMTFDVVIGTLFYHHFTDAELVTFFSHLRERCRIGFIINDIHRHPLAYHSIRLLTQMFSRSDMVKYDAPLSVLRAFTRKELEDILDRAGCTRYSVRWRWAFRWQICVVSQ